MTSVLSYPLPDPFASSITAASRYTHSPEIPSDIPSAPVNLPSVHYSHQASTHGGSLAHQQVAMSSDRLAAGTAVPADEFGAIRGTETTPTHSAPRSRVPSGNSPNLLPVSPSEPIASTSTAHASSHSHNAVTADKSSTSASAAAQRARNRQSHNPTATLNNMNPPSPPRPEHLSDEYVLHPSVYSYKQAHPKRPMVAFGPYVLLQTLGEGEFGKVKLGVHTEYGVEVAIKLIRRGSLDDEVRASKVEREIDVLKTLRHPNIVRMFDVIDTEKYIGIVLEMAGGGELFDHILASRYLKERDAQKLFAQLISGVDYLHKKHIVHRDLKLENLLLDKHRNIIITDFGFANRFEHAADDLMATSCGSPCYAAPELVVSEGLYVGSAVDVWSCGVILYAMLSGYLPYDDDPSNPDGDNINLLYRYIMTTRLHFPDHMSHQAKHLLQLMLVPNPENRCNIQTIMDHPWLAQYRDLFSRSPADHEYIFQETMYHKSQQAKRELAERRRVQAEGRSIKQMQRSQSSAPGVSVGTSGIDQRRVREQRHHSAMPTMSTSTTVPDKLHGAGHRTPPLSASYAEPIGSHMPSAPLPKAVSAPVEQVEAPSAVAPSASTQTQIPSVPIPQPTFQPLAAAGEKPAAKPPLRTNLSNTPPASLVAVENEPIDTESPERPSTPPSRTESQKKEPMSANKNRHTIQVEYDVDASYERMQEKMADRGSPKGKSQALEASSMDLQPVTSDIEMESASDHDGRTDESMMDRTTPETSHIVTPPTVITTIPETEQIADPATPKKSKSAEKQPPTSPSTPRGKTSFPVSEDAILTPPQATRDQTTPRATIQPTGSKRSDSMPGAPTRDSTSAGLDAAGLPLPPTAAKRDRSRKGMSLDKFGLARLLGQTQTADDKAPPSAFARPAGHIKRGSMSRPSTAGGDSKTDKKSKRKTVQLMSNRPTAGSKSKQSEGATPLSPRDLNPTLTVKAQPSPPIVSDTQVHHPHGQSAPSIVTLDALTAQQSAAAKENKQASSNAAKKVMDWFRRKSYAKDTLSGAKTTHLRSDSTSSFVQVSDSPVRKTAAAAENSTANIAMSSTSSFARTVGNTPIIAVTEALLPSEPEPPAVAPEPTDAGLTTKPVATTKAEQDKLDMPAPARSLSHNPTPATPSTAASQTESVVRSRIKTATFRAGVDDSKMRNHNGIVNQSALTSRPPQEVMDEVLRVLQDMGMDVRRENEFRYRCTRVRRRKAGATTGLGLGSVMSVGSTMGSFSLLGNASSSRTDSRGLPLPQSPSTGSLSGGLKGMLLRRGSSYGSSTHLPRSESALSETNLNSPRLTGSPTLPAKEPLYGEHSIDSGDEVKFNVELCRIKNLPGLYQLNIKRLRGNHWSFKFIYQNVIDRCETLTH